MSPRGRFGLYGAALMLLATVAWLVTRPAAQSSPQAAEADAKDSPAADRRPLPRPRGLGRWSPPSGRATADAGLEFGAISGVVLDWDTTRPVVGAELSFLDDTGVHSVISTKGGAFVFEAPAANEYSLASVLAEGYQPYAPGLGHSAVLFVARPGYRVDGVVVHLIPDLELVGTVVAAGGEAVAGASIRTLGVGTGEAALADDEASYTSDASGEFRFTATLGSRFEASHPEHGHGQVEVDERALATRRLTISLDGNAGAADQTIEGIVIDPDGAPLAGARVTAGSVLEFRDSEATTDDDGTFVLEDLAAGEYRVEASHSDFAPVWTPALPTGTVGLRLQLSHGGRIEGTVIGDDERPVTGASVIVLRHNRGLMRVTQARVNVFDAEGTFEVSGLPPGLYDVVGAAHGRGIARVLDIDVDAAPVVVELQLPAGVTLSGHVVDEATGEGIAGARVELERHVGRGPSVAPVFASDVTGDDGVFTLTGVEPGRHSVTAYARDHRARTLSGVEVAEAAVADLRLGLTPDDGSEWSFEFAGIGVEISATPRALDVRGVLEGGGADRAGVVEGDRIVAVDGIPVHEYDFSGAVEALRGMEGTEVALSIDRGGTIVELVAVRARVRG